MNSTYDRCANTTAAYVDFDLGTIYPIENITVWYGERHENSTTSYKFQTKNNLNDNWVDGTLTQTISSVVASTATEIGQDHSSPSNNYQMVRTGLNQNGNEYVAGRYWRLKLTKCSSHQKKWTFIIAASAITETTGVKVTQNEWTLTVTAQVITADAGVTVTQGSSSGTLRTALTGAGTTTIIITAPAGVQFETTVNVVINPGATATTILATTITKATNSIYASGVLNTALSQWTLAVLNTPTIAETQGVTVTQGSSTGTLKTTLSGGATSVIIETTPGVIFLNDADVTIGTTALVHANIDTATQNAVTTRLIIDAADGVTFVNNADLVLGGSEWTMAITSQAITENVGVVVSQNEWTLTITTQTITESAGVTVTQTLSNGVVATGLLKMALSAVSTSVVIHTAAGVTFVEGTDVVVGGTTVLHTTITAAENTLANRGTLKMALSGDTTSIVIETLNGVSFLTTANLIIGSTTVLLTNVNTATKTKLPQTIAVANIQTVTTTKTNNGTSFSGIEFTPR